MKPATHKKQLSLQLFQVHTYHQPPSTARSSSRVQTGVPSSKRGMNHLSTPNSVNPFSKSPQGKTPDTSNNISKNPLKLNLENMLAFDSAKPFSSGLSTRPTSSHFRTASGSRGALTSRPITSGLLTSRPNTRASKPAINVFRENFIPINNKDLRKLTPSRIQTIRQRKPNFSHLKQVLDPELVQDNTLADLEQMKIKYKTMEANFNARPNDARDELYKIFRSFYSTSAGLGFYPLILAALESHAMIAKAYLDLTKAIQLLKQCKLICTHYGAEFEKMKCYHYLTVACREALQYDKALRYVKKQLKLAWKLEDHEHELHAYDSLGMIYYYKGELQMAEYFHNRMKKGLLEPKDSNFRKLALGYIKSSNINRKIKLESAQDYNKNLCFSSGEEDDDDEDIPFNLNIRTYEDLDDYNAIDPRIIKLRQEEKTISEQKRQRAMQFQVWKSQQNTKYIIGDEIRTVQNHKAESKPFRAKDMEKIKNVGQWIIELAQSRHNQLSALQIKDPVLISHLSTNRVLENYQIPDMGAPFGFERGAPNYQIELPIKSRILKSMAQFKTELDRHIEFVKYVRAGNSPALKELKKKKEEEEAQKKALLELVSNSLGSRSQHRHSRASSGL